MHRFAHKLVHREECFACLDERNDLDPSAETPLRRGDLTLNYPGNCGV